MMKGYNQHQLSLEYLESQKVQLNQKDLVNQKDQRVLWGPVNQKDLVNQKDQRVLWGPVNQKDLVNQKDQRDQWDLQDL
jgi:hypothetical protein